MPCSKGKCLNLSLSVYVTRSAAVMATSALGIHLSFLKILAIGIYMHGPLIMKIFISVIPLVL